MSLTVPTGWTVYADGTEWRFKPNTLPDVKLPYSPRFLEREHAVKCCVKTAADLAANPA